MANNDPIDAIDIVGQKYRELIILGKCQDEVITMLKSDRLHFVDAIKIVRSICRINSGEAKRLVVGHTAWVQEANYMDILPCVRMDTWPF